MTISIAAKTLTSVQAYHNKEPRVPFDNDAPDGFQMTIGNQTAWLSEEDAARLAEYLTGGRDAGR